MHDHFEGKAPLEHVLEARKKGKLAASEIHGEELSGHINALADSAKETAVILILLMTLFDLKTFPLVFLFGWLLWKVGRSALLGWRRLERLHRIIEEERWEIEHRRSQEKEELRALYEAKGFSGKLLDEVIEVLMADDNRLLQIMLEEELGLSLETFEHPLKQAVGAALGVLGSALIIGIGNEFFSFWGALLGAALMISLSSGITARWEKNKATPAIIWNLAAVSLAVGCAYFLGQGLYRS